MARLIISVEVAGVRAIAGPMTAAAVMFDAQTREPVFAIAGSHGGVPKRYSLRDVKRIPRALVARIAAHIKKMAISSVIVHRPAFLVTTPKETSWVVMGQAAARVAERAVHQERETCQVGAAELEIYIPDGGGYCPYVSVGRIGQRPVADDWHRGAALILARQAHFDAISVLHVRFPQYDFPNNLGNTSQVHLRALRRFGRTPEHRSSHG